MLSTAVPREGLVVVDGARETVPLVAAAVASGFPLPVSGEVATVGGLVKGPPLGGGVGGGLASPR